VRTTLNGAVPSARTPLFAVQCISTAPRTAYLPSATPYVMPAAAALYAAPCQTCDIPGGAAWRSMPQPRDLHLGLTRGTVRGRHGGIAVQNLRRACRHLMYGRNTVFVLAATLRAGVAATYWRPPRYLLAHAATAGAKFIYAGLSIRAPCLSPILSPRYLPGPSTRVSTGSACACHYRIRAQRLSSGVVTCFPTRMGGD